MILNVLLSILDENQAMKQKLDEALAEKAEIDLVNSKADSVDRTIIEALKREGEEQKEKVQILLSNDLENAHTTFKASTILSLKIYFLLFI